MTPQGRAELYLFGTTFIWGGTFVVVKFGLADISPVLLVALRFSMAAALLILFGARRILRIDRTLFWKGSLLGFLLFIGFTLQTIGLKDTTASKSAFITGLMVIFTPFFQFAIEKRLPKPGNFVGVVIVTAGLWLLTSPSGGGITRGDFLTLLCAAVFGVYIVMLDLISKGSDPFHLTFLQMIPSALLGWFAAFFLETPAWNPTIAAVGVVVYCALLGNILCGYVQTRYQRDTTPTRAVIIFTIEPLWATLLGYAALREVIGYWGMAGGAMIIGGILISEFSDSASSSPGPQ
jgi:drug/metabolite transporter (DMT)-like permease